MNKEPKRNKPTSIDDIAPAMGAVETEAKRIVAEQVTERAVSKELVEELTAPFPPLMYSRPVIEMTPEPEEPELEFRAVTVKLQEVPGPVPKSMVIDQKAETTVEAFLSDGWQIDETITCPPFAMIVFSREKEQIEEEITNEA